MLFCASSKLEMSTHLDALIIPYFQSKNEAELCANQSFVPQGVGSFLLSGDFSGKEGECLISYCDNSASCKRVILIGLGKKDSLTVESLRRAYGSLVKQLKKKKKCEEIKVLYPQINNLEASQVLEGICEGILLANYSFTELKSENKNETSKLKSVCIIGIDDKSGQLCQQFEIIHRGVSLARDLINSNADDITPQKLSQVAIEFESEFSNLKVKVLNKQEIEKNKMGLILAVNRGGPLDPAVILLEYQGNPNSQEYSAVVGKGITYDTGGLNLKPTGSMETMKCDMSGAATVLGLIQVIASLKLPVNVIGAVASTENAIGPLSYKPGDVYRSYSGKMVEITNTDAEGRLVLADLIAYLQDKYKLSRIIDLATLTGAIVVALGEEITGLFSNNDELVEALISSGEKTYERVWRMPILSEYKDYLKSSIADIKNAGPRKAGSATAALFIQEFIKDNLPWAHLDIAGTAYLSELKNYHTTPATGVGVRLLADFFFNLNKK